MKLSKAGPPTPQQGSEPRTPPKVVRKVRPLDPLELERLINVLERLLDSQPQGGPQLFSLKTSEDDEPVALA